MLRTKKFEGFRDLYLEPLEGTDEWYSCKECEDTFCDLYEAEEIVAKCGEFNGATVYVIHYPDGKIHRPFPMKKNKYIEQPVFLDGKLMFLEVDFSDERIRIHEYDPKSEKVSLITEMPLGRVKDCYNLRLFTRPLTLGRGGNNGTYEIVWPEEKIISIGDTETILYRDHNKLYSTAWKEEPSYRETILIRDIRTGALIEQFVGSMYAMPDGRFWIMTK